MERSYYSTGATAARAGVSPSTLIVWERRGLLPAAARINSGTHRADRIYSEADVQKIIRIARERGLGAELGKEAA